MGDKEANTNYNLKDIERYLQGRMTAKEMHAMERSALQDPFLADAIEGYSEASLEVSEQHLNEITAALQTEKKEEARLVAMPQSNKSWLKLAAMVVLIVGVGLVSFLMFNNGGEKESVAKNEAITVFEEDTIKAIEEQQESMADEVAVRDMKAGKKETTSVDKKNTKVKGSAPLNKNEEVNKAIVSEADQTSATSTISNAPPNIGSDTVLNSATASDNTTVTEQQSLPESLQGKAAGIVTNSNEIKGRVTDISDEPVPNAVVKLNDNTTTITDLNGYFNFKTSDSIAKADVNAVGYATVSTPVKSNVLNNIVLEEASGSLSEVAVTGMNTKRQANKPAEKNDSRPVGGWQSFEEYVYKKLGKEYDSTNNNAFADPEIDLEFLINETGEPYNFRIIHSKDDKKADEVIEAIKTGPRWIADEKEKKARVKLKF